MAKIVEASNPFVDKAFESRGPHDPSARPFKPAIMKGDYPGPEEVTRVDGYMGDEYTVVQDLHFEEQSRKRRAAENEGGPLGGMYGSWPDRGHPLSPEEKAAVESEDAYLRAVHGGLPDAPDGAPRAVLGGKPFKF